MRCIAVPHFLIALLFTASSRRLRSARHLARFLGLLALGVGLCFLYARLGGRAAPLPGALFLGYFLDFALHERTYAIVSLHVAAWFVFVLHQR